MNEFIVWDEMENKFLIDGIGMIYDDVESSTHMSSKGEVQIHNYFNEYEEDLTYPYEEKNKLIAFRYIGKTDDTPEQNKIYTDCSIVEFEYKNRTSKGFFVFNNETLQYDVKHLVANHSLPFSLMLEKGLENLKVIGTLQENPELLKMEEA